MGDDWMSGLRRPTNTPSQMFQGAAPGNYLNGLRGGYAEMQASGLPASAGPAASLPVGGGNVTGSISGNGFNWANPASSLPNWANPAGYLPSWTNPANTLPNWAKPPIQNSWLPSPLGPLGSGGGSAQVTASTTGNQTGSLPSNSDLAGVLQSPQFAELVQKHPFLSFLMPLINMGANGGLTGASAGTNGFGGSQIAPGGLGGNGQNLVWGGNISGWHPADTNTITDASVGLERERREKLMQQGVS